MLNSHKTTSALLIGTALTSWTFSHAAAAQTAKQQMSDEQYETSDSQDVGSNSSEVAEIIVTAQGRKQEMRDVPISLTATTGAALENAQISNLEALSVRMPNFRIATAPVSDFVNIRGIGSSLNLGFEQSVGTFVDGIYRGRSRATRAALFDLERVEILKGPQTTFFGNNTIAGALNITTRKPSYDFAMNGSALYVPRTDEYSIEAGIDVPVTNQLAVRIVGRQSGMGGYIKNELSGDKGPDLDNTIGRLAARWEPSSDIEVNARIDVGRTRNKGIYNVELVGCPPDSDFPGPTGACLRYLNSNNGSIDDRLDFTTNISPSYINNDFIEAVNTISVNIGSHQLTSTTGYFGHDYKLLNDVIPIPPAQGGSVVGTEQSLPVGVDEKFRQYSQEVRLSSDDSMPLSYMLGAYYSHSKLDINFYQGYYFARFGTFSGGEFAATDPILLLVRTQEKADNFSVFGSGTLRIGDSFRVNGGLRYTRVKKNNARMAQLGIIGRLFDPSSFEPGTMAGQAVLMPIVGADPGDYSNPRRTDSKVLPSVSVQYDATPDIMIYGSYTEGFKAGGYSVGVSKSSFDPENVSAYEAGLKASLFSRKLNIALAAFYSKFENLQETTTIVSGLSSRQIVGNVAASISKGIELSTTADIIDGFQLSIDVAYLSSKYSNYENAPCTSKQAIGVTNCVQDLSGKRRAFSPKFSGNIGAQYSSFVGDRFKIIASSNLYFSSKFFQQPIADPMLSQSGNAKLDARIAFGESTGKWEFAVIGKNLTGKNTASYRQIIPSAVGSIQVLPDEPRTVGFQVKVNY